MVTILIPFLILLASFGLDWLEMVYRRNLWLNNPPLYLWLQGFNRIVFALVVGLGFYHLFRQPFRHRQGFAWLGWGLAGMVISLPMAKSFPLTNLLSWLPPLFFTYKLFYLASAFLVVGGGIVLLSKPRRDSFMGKNEPQARK